MFLCCKGLAQQISHKAVGSFDIFIPDKSLMCCVIINDCSDAEILTSWEVGSLKLYCLQLYNATD